MCAATFLPISAGSTSMCTTFARWANSSSVAGHAVVEPRADRDDRSASSIAQFAVRVPCMPSIPSQRRSHAGNAPSAISVVVTGRSASRASAVELGRGLRVHDAAAGVEHRPPRRRDRLRGRSAPGARWASARGR